MYYYVSPIIEFIFVFSIATFCIAGLQLFDAVRKKNIKRKRICIISIIIIIVFTMMFYFYLKQLT